MDRICEDSLFCRSSDCTVISIKISHNFHCDIWTNPLGSGRLSSYEDALLCFLLFFFIWFFLLLSHWITNMFELCLYLFDGNWVWFFISIINVKLIWIMGICIIKFYLNLREKSWVVVWNQSARLYKNGWDWGTCIYLKPWFSCNGSTFWSLLFSTAKCLSVCGNF